jgi:hypothetical protein
MRLTRSYASTALGSSIPSKLILRVIFNRNEPTTNITNRIVRKGRINISTGIIYGHFQLVAIFFLRIARADAVHK